MQKLKVFRTPIGFHDAYVASPSRKAALKAWGSDADLFARGVAEEVKEAALMRAPLDHPGEVVKVARGSAAEHLAAAGAKQGRSEKRALPRSRGKDARSRPRPSRETLSFAEEALQTLNRKYAEAVDDLSEKIEDLKRRLAEIEIERRDLNAEHDRNRKDAQAAIDHERERHSAALDEWLAAQD